ncbi:hypothetical protein WA026_000773 [Henosepilachna vigintioctopunctata]|uniref:Uncharacterized protein n=1 Tax=Henosepilachna vigintioctopunctata TaxID=420089 RepID=A0AAW1V567_9CUCU
MSTQRGNSSRTRPQKHKNQTAFKNTLHDTSHRTKIINSIEVKDVCSRCKDVIEWKIKYKKYKALTQPKTCVSCGQKTVKQAYHVMCIECGKKLGKCTKCCQGKEVIKALPERKRRTFRRYMDKKEKEGISKEELKEDLLMKLETLKVEDSDSEGHFDLDCDDSVSEEEL